MLIFSILGGSSIGVLSNFMPVNTPFAKNAWRSGFIMLFLSGPAYMEYQYKRIDVDYTKLFTLKEYCTLLCALVS